MKLRWLLDNVRTVQKAVEENRALFGTIDSWLIWVCLNVMNAQRMVGGFFLTVLPTIFVQHFRLLFSIIIEEKLLEAAECLSPFERHFCLLPFLFFLFHLSDSRR